MEISGYKVFHSDMTNWCGMKFEEGKTYIDARSNGSGFYYCTKLADTFVNYWGNKDVKVAKVTGFFDNKKSENPVLIARTIRIDKILTREEVLHYVLEQGEEETIKYLKYCYLNPNEKQFFLDNYSENEEYMRIISHYQKEVNKPKQKK